MSRNTRYDSMVMKTLSFVGMMYLPGTFVSVRSIRLLSLSLQSTLPPKPPLLHKSQSQPETNKQQGIFGSNFFDFQAGEKESWEMSREFWLYWAVTIPLTLATFAVWALWHYRTKLGFGGFLGRRRIDDTSEKV